MSKIKLKTVIKGENEDYIYTGFGIKNKNKIIYFDNNIKTTIILNDVITIKRTSEYEIILNFKEGQCLESFYLTPYGKINVNVQTIFLKQEKNTLEIHYTLLNENEKIENFIFNLEYSIDT